ncbi:hypothetical protein OE88DRAFT_186587 [Heliocybe sulcata]|uniref:Uncharacterized protein n=1 Tax=Heliocybe sulcata TaxID=5364 RepID=A0A5C3N061_9AGAM|nr:hypothetical protein OE88DRAFT_186587 [Heliocybe sulcata]
MIVPDGVAGTAVPEAVADATEETIVPDDKADVMDTMAVPDAVADAVGSSPVTVIGDPEEEKVTVVALEVAPGSLTPLAVTVTVTVATGAQVDPMVELGYTVDITVVAGLGHTKLLEATTVFVPDTMLLDGTTVAVIEVGDAITVVGYDVVSGSKVMVGYAAVSGSHIVVRNELV